MRSGYILSILFFFPLLVIQTTVIPLVEIEGVIPDLILIMLVYYAIRYGQIYGIALGFIYGFFLDLIAGSLLGSVMFTKTLAGFIGGYFSNENKREIYLSTYFFSLIVLLCATVDSFIFSFFSSIDLTRNIFISFFEQGVFPGLYTAVVSIVVVIFRPRRSIS